MKPVARAQPEAETKLVAQMRLVTVMKMVVQIQPEMAMNPVVQIRLVPAMKLMGLNL